MAPPGWGSDVLLRAGVDDVVNLRPASEPRRSQPAHHLEPAYETARKAARSVRKFEREEGG